MVYSLSSFGFQVKLHYCDGVLNSITWFGNSPNCGCDEEEEAEEACCEDEQFYFKLATDQVKTISVSLEKIPVIVFPMNLFHTAFFDSQRHSISSYAEMNDPPPGKVRLHILIQKFSC